MKEDLIMYVHANLTNHENTVFDEPSFPFRRFAFDGADTLPHWHGHIEFIRIPAGCCRVRVDGYSAMCVEGDLCFVPSGALHAIETEGVGAYVAVVVGEKLFSDASRDADIGSLLAPVFREGACSFLHFKGDDPTSAGIHSLFDDMCKEASDRNPGWKMMLKARFLELMTLIFRLHPEATIPPATTGRMSTSLTTIRTVLRHIEHHYAEPLTLSEMSRQANLTPQHFSRLFKTVTGKTFIAYLTDYRLDMAMQLLRATDIPIARIPELTGFCNSNYFSRIFLKRCGATPSAFRRRGFDAGALHSPLNGI